MTGEEVPGPAAARETPGPAVPGRPTGDVVSFTSELTPWVLTRALSGATVASVSTLTLLSSGPVLLLVAGLTGSEMLLRWGLTLLVGIPVVPLVAFGTAYINARRPAMKRMYEPVGLTFSDDGVVIETAGEVREAGWDEFVRWRRMAGTHLLYNTRRTFIVLRTDEVPPEDLAAFERLLRAHVAEGPRR